MTPSEAKFILRAHRTDGRYPPDDPLFAEALALAEDSPELADWLAREHALDQTVANKLEAVQPPAGLRETILAGARASRLPRRWWQQPRWLGLAASLALVGLVGIGLQFSRTPNLRTGDFAHLALDDYGTRQHQHNYAPALAALVEALGSRPTRLSTAPSLSMQQLRDANCTELQLDGRTTYEVCFERDGTWFHLYVTRLDQGRAPETDRRPMFLEQDQVAAAAWTDGTHLYALVTRAGTEALRKVV